MKRILYLSVVTITIAFQNISPASAAKTEISNNDFTHLVCGYLHRMEDKSEAINKIKILTESKINNNQLVILEKIAKSDRVAKEFCSSALPRF